MAKSVCQVVEDGKACAEQSTARDMCPMHYRRWRLYGNPLRLRGQGRRAVAPKGQCTAVDDGQRCVTAAEVRGMCRRHYGRAHANGTLAIIKPNYRTGRRPKCAVDECDLECRVKGYCHKHYRRFRVYGDPHVVKLEKTGEFRMNGDGYMVRAVVVDGVREYQREHRVVMERMLGRKLLPGENVHHIDGNKSNNRPENLELWTCSQPSGQRVEDKIVWALEFLETYAPHYLATDVQIALPLRR